VCICCNHGCAGAGTQISGSSSGHLNILAPAPQQIGLKNQKKSCIICITGLPHEIYLWKWNPNFRLQLHHLKAFGSCSSHTKFLGLQLHSPGRNVAFFRKVSWRFLRLKYYFPWSQTQNVQQWSGIFFIFPPGNPWIITMIKYRQRYAILHSKEVPQKIRCWKAAEKAFRFVWWT